ncbi:MAG: TRCF domain-containing protein, partial [Bacteroidaceae bacterium]|nr:TRCF domain-containing protein [Bacteroidaceae bacterium]
KQVAVLVPTTVLAHQHYRTFCKRLKNFSVRVEYLSRARTAKQTKEVLSALEKGEVNILVGTHKLLGKTVKFHDLGLLIVDEEQKFGVSTKEKLRQMRTNVDTLTLTATPIPRTLQFSLMGARDLSVIQTPPPNRHPIQTEVHTFDAQVIADAIQFEMSRNGQVYLINNRISNLPELEALVHKYVPDARVAVGHGRMPSEQLEEIVIGFANYDYDVLIATTIVESGIDIPNANTIIINGAQNFGLSDLHQMRGRVGRSNKKAFCYLLAPPLSGLSNDARRRLQAIENFSDLGSGIHIAMQDLDIRGAGNLLGAEQSGFIADLGYETYQKILAQAVKELRNDEFQELYAQQMEEGEPIDGQDFVEECQLDSDIPMLFPESYVPGSSERMLLYRELDGLQTDEQIEQFRKRMVDRFGPIPPEGEELIRVVALRHLGMYFGAERIVLKQGRMRLVFVQNDSSPFFQSQAFGQIIAFASTNVHRCRLEEKDGRRSLLVTGVKSVEQAVALLRQMQQVKAV